MAAPTIRGNAAPLIQTNGLLAINSPSSTQVGDLLVFFVWTQGGNSTTITHTLQSGFFDWFQHAHEDGTTDGRLSVCVKKAASPGAVSYSPYNVANGNASQTTIGLIVITAGTYQPNLDTVLPVLGTATTNTGNQPPDPPQVTGLTGDYLVLAFGAWHVTTAGGTIATAQANYTIEIQNASTSHVTHIAVSRRALTGLSGATENPGAWTDNVTPNGTATQTIAIRAPASVSIGALVVDGGGSVAVAGMTRATTLSALAIDGGGTLDIAGMTRGVPLGALAADGGGSIAIADMTITGGGPTDHALGSLVLDGGGALDVVGMTRGVPLGALAVDGGGGVAIGPIARDAKLGAVAIDGASSLEIAAITRATSLGAIAADGAGLVAIADMTITGQGVEHDLGALQVVGEASIAVTLETYTDQPIHLRTPIDDAPAAWAPYWIPSWTPRR